MPGAKNNVRREVFYTGLWPIRYWPQMHVYFISDTSNVIFNQAICFAAITETYRFHLDVFLISISFQYQFPVSQK